MKFRRFKQFGLTSLVATIVGIAVASPASAVPPDHFSIDYDGVVNSLCGMTVVLDGFEHGTFHVKPRRDGTEVAGFIVHYSIRVTNVATGRWLLSEFNGSNKDLKVTDEGDGIITVIGQVAGIDRYYNSDGTRVFQAAGNTRVELRVDLGDPDDPDDDVLLDEEKLKDVGLRFGAGDCDTIRGLIG